MDDLISRQAAIDVVKRLMGDSELSRTVQTGLDILPSAQPDVTDTNVGDTISRQAAIDVLEAKKDKSAKGDIGCFYNTIIQNNIDALKGLPSAQPKIIKCKDCKNSPLKMWFSCPLSHLPFDGERWCWKGVRDE